MIRIGVMGLGVGECHARAFAAHPDCALALLCDRDEVRLREVAARFPGVPSTTRVEDVLCGPGVDVVVIATYDDQHADQTVAALDNGRHVFVEKPLCQTREQLAAIRAALSQHPELRLGTNFPLRTSPRFKRVKALVDEGAFGGIYYVEGDYNYGRMHKITRGWRGRLGFYSVTQGGGVHMADLLMWLVGSRVTEVQAMGNRLASAGTDFRFDDCVAALLRFENGVVGKLASNFGCVHPHFHRLMVYGRDASFENRLDGGLFHTSRDTQSRPVALDEAYSEHGDMTVVHSFVDAIVRDAAMYVPGEAAFDAMAVCLAIDAAVRSGATERVAYI